MNNRVERYISPEGYTVDCPNVYLVNGDGLICLSVQTSEEKDSFRSQIRYAKDFSTSRQTVTAGEIGWVTGGHDGTVFLLGDKGLVLRQNGQLWEDLKFPEQIVLYELRSRTNGEIYVVGEGGSFYVYSQDNWQQIELETDVELFCAHLQKEGGLIIGGESGFCGVYEDSEFSQFSAPTDIDIQSIAEFNGEVFFGAGFKGIYKLSGKNLEEFKPNIFGYHLDANNKFLAACGQNEVARFDGKGWDVEIFE